MKSVSSAYFVTFTTTGRPWGQYRTSPLCTFSTKIFHSAGSLVQPPLMAALQAPVCSSASRFSSRFRPVRRFCANSSRVAAVSAARACLIVLWVGPHAFDLDARSVSYNVGAYLSGQLETSDADYLRTLNGGEEALSRLE